MVELAHQLRAHFQANQPDAFGEILHEGWRLKKSLTTGISTKLIDNWYSKARKAGAVGGKLLGAGTGGFLLFVAPPDKHEAIAHALRDLRRMDFRMQSEGSRIIFVHR